MEPFVIQRSALRFRGWQPNFQKWLRNFEVTASKFNIDRPLTSMASKTAHKFFLKIASNQFKFSKYWWVWILGRGRKKTKRPQQWGVMSKCGWANNPYFLSQHVGRCLIGINFENIISRLFILKLCRALWTKRYSYCLPLFEKARYKRSSSSYWIWNPMDWSYGFTS